MSEEGGGGDGPGVKNENGELFDGSQIFLGPGCFFGRVGPGGALVRKLCLGSCEVLEKGAEGVG